MKMCTTLYMKCIRGGGGKTPQGEKFYKGGKKGFRKKK